jgi:hypothetical protein
MNFILTMILCSGVSLACLPPYQVIDTFYEDQYSCLLKGYEKSIEQMEKMGRVVVNEKKLFIKFYCIPRKKIDA